ncbi:MAG: response regulator [Planctomycetota bacterium]
MNIYFTQECPTCGRNLRVRVEYLGKKVACQHCGAKFAACEPGSPEADAPHAGESLLKRADELLESAEASGIGVRGE